MTEKLIQEIHRLKDSLDGYSAREALDYIESYINIISREQPSLPSNIDEAAQEYSLKTYGIDNIAISEDIKRAIKFGAEWVIRQRVKARCVESSNPVSENQNQRLHLITLLYEENENTPYVVSGDDVELILRKTRNPAKS